MFAIKSPTAPFPREWEGSTPFLLIGMPMRKSVLILGHNDAPHFVDIYNQYARVFNPAEYEVTVVYLTGAKTQAVADRTLADEVIFLDLPKRSLRYLKLGALWQLYKLCLKKKFEIVICHRYKPIYLMLLLAQRFHFKKMIFVLHELGTMRARGRQTLIAALKRDNMRFAGVSNAVRDDLRASLWGMPKDHIITLYNMIDIDLIEPQLLSREAARKALGFKEDDFVFGNLARLVPNKDQATLLNAFAKVHANYPHARLIVMGTGQLENALKEQAKQLNIAEAVTFTGFVSGAFRYLKAFDCFVLSSKQEAFGRVLIEAMVARLPLIATAVHGIPEVVGPAGKIVAAGASDEFANAMQEIMQLPAHARTTLGEACFERATNVFSIPVFNQLFWQTI